MLGILRYVFAKLVKKCQVAAVRRATIHGTSKVEAGTTFVESAMDRHSFCGYDCEIYRATIGSFTSIANGVVLGGARHPMEWVGMSPVFYAGRDSVKKKFAQHILVPPPHVHIGHDVWIGRSAIVLSGVSVGNGAVIGAGSVVTKHVPPYAIVAGNPARIIRYRFSEQIIRSLENLKWWNFSDQRIAELGYCFRDVEKFLEVTQGSV